MKMVSMERESLPQASQPVNPDSYKYPYGLKICLSKEELDKLGIKELPKLGANMKVMATVEVCGVSMSEYEGGEYRSVDLQIVEMGIEGKKADPASKLYNGDSAEGEA